MNIQIPNNEKNKNISLISNGETTVSRLENHIKQINKSQNNQYNAIKEFIEEKSQYFSKNKWNFISIVNIMAKIMVKSINQNYELLKLNVEEFSENFRNKIQNLENNSNKKDPYACFEFFESKEIIQEIKDSGYSNKLQAFYIHETALNVMKNSFQLNQTINSQVFPDFNIDELIKDNKRSKELYKSYMNNKNVFLVIKNIINLAKIIEKDPNIIIKLTIFIKDNLEEKVNEANIYCFFNRGSTFFANHKELANELYKTIASFSDLAQNYQKNKEKFDIMLKTYDNLFLTIDKIEVVRTGNMFLNYLNSKEFKVSSEEKKEDINTLKELLKVCQFNLAKDVNGNINNISENLQQFVELIPKIKEIKEYQEYNETINTYRNSQIERSFELLN